jgi:hypothetical protein
MADLDRDWSWTDMQEAHWLIDTFEEAHAKAEFERQRARK